MAFVLPSVRQAGYLDPEISGEGVKVIMSDGESISYNPPAPKPVMPDWSGIKSIRHYFNRTDFKIWPAWVYHPTEEPRIVKNEHEAAEIGICYREATIEEKGRYGLSHVWDWKDDCLWRPKPYATGARKYDPRKPEAGKEFIATPQSSMSANRELLNTVLPEVTAAVVAALKQGGSVAPDNINPKDWDQFLEFQAWRKTQEAADALLADDEPQAPVLTAGDDTEDERAQWEAEAIRKNIKIDGRWSLERLKTEVQKAA